MKKRSILAALLCCCMVGLMACQSNDTETEESGGDETSGDQIQIAYVAPNLGTPYFTIGADGAKAKGEELGYEVTAVGPATEDAAEQSQMIEEIVNQGEADALVVACLDSSSPVPALTKARESGMKVVTWDLDCEAEGRDCYAGLMDLVLMGNDWVDSMVRTIGEEGQYAIITATTTNEFMNQRIENMKTYAAENYPDLELLTVESCDADTQKAYQISQDLITRYPEMKCILTVSTEAYTSAAKAIEDMGVIGDVYVAGGVMPSMAKSAFESGAAEESVLWDPGQWAGFAVEVAGQLVEDKTFTPGEDPEIPGFENVEVAAEDTLYYHEPMIFTKDNVDDYDF